MTFAETNELARLDALAATLHRTGSPGLGEEIDRCRLAIARVIRERDAARDEAGGLRRELGEVRGTVVRTKRRGESPEQVGKRGRKGA